MMSGTLFRAHRKLAFHLFGSGSSPSINLPARKRFHNLLIWSEMIYKYLMIRMWNGPVRNIFINVPMVYNHKSIVDKSTNATKQIYTCRVHMVQRFLPLICKFYLLDRHSKCRRGTEYRRRKKSHANLDDNYAGQTIACATSEIARSFFHSFHGILSTLYNCNLGRETTSLMQSLLYTRSCSPPCMQKDDNYHWLQQSEMVWWIARQYLRTIFTD